MIKKLENLLSKLNNENNNEANFKDAIINSNSKISNI